MMEERQVWLYLPKCCVRIGETNQGGLRNGNHHHPGAEGAARQSAGAGSGPAGLDPQSSKAEEYVSDFCIASSTSI